MNIKSSKKNLYKSYSYFSIFRFYCYNIIYIILFIYCISNYTENPTFILFSAFIITILIVLNGYGRIFICEEYLTIKVYSFLNIFSTKRSFRLVDIELIKANLPLSEKKHLLNLLIPSFLSSVIVMNSLKITFKNGNTEEVNTQIYRQEFLNGFEIIESNFKVKVELSLQ